MDTEHPYVGGHTPMVKLSQTEMHGIQQSGLAVRKGRSYTGRAVLAGTPVMAVKVTLIWGSGANDRQSVTIAKLRAQYLKIPLSFKVESDTDDAPVSYTHLTLPTNREV